MRNDNQPSRLIFGAVLHRASELIGDQGVACYDALGVGVDARKNSVVLALWLCGPLTSSDLAEQTGHSRQRIEARLKALVAEGFVETRRCETDRRRRLYQIAEGRQETMRRVAHIMADFEQVYDALWREIGVDVEGALLKMERALQFKSLTTRLCEHDPRYLADRGEAATGGAARTQPRPPDPA